LTAVLRHSSGIQKIKIKSAFKRHFDGIFVAILWHEMVKTGVWPEEIDTTLIITLIMTYADICFIIQGINYNNQRSHTMPSFSIASN